MLKKGRHSLYRTLEPMWFISGVQRGLAGIRLRRNRACWGVRPTLAPVAFDAAAHDVFPGRTPPERARDHVVEVEFGTVGSLAAILAGELIPGKDIDAAVTHVTLGYPVETR